MSSKNNKWSRGHKIALWSFIVTLVGIVVPVCVKVFSSSKDNETNKNGSNLANVDGDRNIVNKDSHDIYLNATNNSGPVTQSVNQTAKYTWSNWNTWHTVSNYNIVDLYFDQTSTITPKELCVKVESDSKITSMINIGLSDRVTARHSDNSLIGIICMTPISFTGVKVSFETAPHTIKAEAVGSD